MSVCKKVVVKKNIKESYARQWRGPQVGCSRSPPAGERHRDPGIPAPAPKIHQRKRMAQARRTTDLQPHPSPSETQRNSSIIAIPNQPADPQTPPIASHYHTRLPTTFEDASMKCDNLNVKPTCKNQRPQTPDPPFP